MKDFQNMKQSITPDDPLSKGIVLFKKKRDQADMIEHIFRNIKNTYKISDIDAMKNHLDSKLSQSHPTYQTPVAASYFNQLKSKLSNEAFSLREFIDHKIVVDYQHPDKNQSVPNKVTGEVFIPQLPITQLQNQTYQGGNPPIGQPMSTGRNTPSRVDRVTSTTIANPAVLGAAAQKQVSFTPAQTASNKIEPHERRPVSPQTTTQNGGVGLKNYSVSEQSRSVTVQQSQGSITAGSQPKAQVSADKTEVTLNYSLAQPKVSLVKNIALDSTGGVPNTILALDDKNVLVGCSDGRLQVIDVHSHKVTKQIKLGAPIKCLERFSDDGRTRIPFGILIGLGAPENCIALVDLAESVGPCISTFRGHTGEISCLAALGGGEFLSGGSDGILSLWSASSNSAAKSAVKAHNYGINSIAILSSGRTIATGGDDSMVRLFNLEHGQLIPKGEIVQSNQVVLVDAFHGNSRFLLIGLSNGLLRICNADSGECLKELPGHRGAPLGALKVLGAADVFLLSFARGEDAPGLTTVDENSVSRYPLDRPLVIDYAKTGQRIVQIIAGQQDSGFSFVLLEQDRTSSQVLLSCWNLS
jgi:WD40 repeat protein